MSLSSLLLGGGSSGKSKQKSSQIIDTDLDALFRSNVRCAHEPIASDAAYRDPPEHNRPTDDDSDTSDGDNDASHLTHESVAKTPKKIKAVSTKSKFVPPDETTEQRDARTIFIGNLPVEVAQKRVRLLSLFDNCRY